MDLELSRIDDTREQSFGFGHTLITKESAERLAPDSIHRIAYNLSSILADIPSASLGNAKPLLVGSYVISPDTANDLDFEIYGVTWEGLQDWFSKHGPELISDGMLKSVFLTKGLEDGTIPQDRTEEGLGGNAYVAIWLVHSTGKRINISVPCTVDGNTNRYNLNSVHRDPDLTPLEASRRRNFAHKTFLLDMLGGKLLDPHDGEQALLDRKLVILDPAFKNDPVNLWGAIIEMADRVMTPDQLSENILREMAGTKIDFSDSGKVFAERLQYERSRLLFGSLPASRYLEIARNLGAFEHQATPLHTMSDDAFRHAMIQADLAWETAKHHDDWGSSARAGHVLAYLAKEVLNQATDRISTDTIIRDFLQAFNWKEGEQESVFSVALRTLDTLTPDRGLP